MKLRWQNLTDAGLCVCFGLLLYICGTWVNANCSQYMPIYLAGIPVGYALGWWAGGCSRKIGLSVFYGSAALLPIIGFSLPIEVFLTSYSAVTAIVIASSRAHVYVVHTMSPEERKLVLNLYQFHPFLLIFVIAYLARVAMQVNSTPEGVGKILINTIIVTCLSVLLQMEKVDQPLSGIETVQESQRA